MPALYTSTHTHAQTHFHTIWGQRTDGAKSGYCRQIGQSWSVLITICVWMCVCVSLSVCVWMCVYVCVCVCLWTCSRFPEKRTLGKAVSQILSTGMESKTDSLCSSSLSLRSCLSKIDAGCEHCRTVHVWKFVPVMAWTRPDCTAEACCTSWANLLLLFIGQEQISTAAILTLRNTKFEEGKKKGGTSVI